MKRCHPLYRFGPYTLEPQARRLKLRGADVPLSGKAFDLLLLFVTAGGSALSREHLYECLWPNEAVEDGNLSQNVYLVRRALDRDGYRSIETVPRFGYRFLPEVRETEQRAANLSAIRVAAAIAAILILGVAAWTTTPASAPMPADAVQSYALGVFHVHLRTPREIEHARHYFEQTIAFAPRRAAGYAGLASAYALLGEYYPEHSKMWRYYLERARNAVADALEREPQNSDALAAAGFIAYRFDQNAARAKQYLDAALTADPENASAHHWHGVLLLAQGDTAGAIADLQAAHRIEPTSEVFMRWLARAYTYGRRPREALAVLGDALRIEPHDEGSLIVQACAQEESGDLRAALQTLNILAQDPWEQRFVTPDIARVQALLDRAKTPALTKRVDEAVARKSVDSFEASLFYLTVGMRARANELLHRSHPSLIAGGLEKNDPRYASLGAS